MQITSELIKQLIFTKTNGVSRFTQDSPVYPDVWLSYYEHAGELDTFRQDLILTPNKNFNAAALFKEISNQLRSEKKTSDIRQSGIASNGDSIVARVTLKELISDLLPLTNWYQTRIVGENQESIEYLWLARLVGAIILSGSDTRNQGSLKILTERFEKAYPAFRYNTYNRPRVLWSVNRNRTASVSIELSVPATKADAGRRVFGIDGSGIVWAVLDSGIDATHSAFRKTEQVSMRPYPDAFGPPGPTESNFTRVAASYDFTKFRDIMSRIHVSGSALTPGTVSSTGDDNDQQLDEGDIREYINDIGESLRRGRLLDWTVIAPLLRIPHNNVDYQKPRHRHGTHVAGIIGAGKTDDPLNLDAIGMCPGIGLYDLRVIDETGTGEEFNILAAIQFISWLNYQRDVQVIHGANMSFSLIHSVASFACGQTPVCVASDKLVAQGTVVVTSAGNLGQTRFISDEGIASQGFRTVSITDPGNAESVITVGATHKSKPHTYGVSYFSSKGPTGDGRIKPDLVAPGEKITSCGLDNDYLDMDGTSMAAPHVSGAAALILSKNRELIGCPAKIKSILCRNATDLGRERYFQGCGMLDVLRAIQSI